MFPVVKNFRYQNLVSKTKSVYSCNECGAQSPKWVGQCPGCNAWNTLVETVVASKSMPERGLRFGAPTDAPVVQSLDTGSAAKIVRIPPRPAAARGGANRRRSWCDSRSSRAWPCFWSDM